MEKKLIDLISYSFEYEVNNAIDVLDRLVQRGKDIPNICEKDKKSLEILEKGIQEISDSLGKVLFKL